MKKSRPVNNPLIKETYIMSGGGIIGSPASYAIPVVNTSTVTSPSTK